MCGCAIQNTFLRTTLQMQKKKTIHMYKIKMHMSSSMWENDSMK